MNEENQPCFLIICNEIDADGWALIAPYGEHPKSRVAKVNGVPTEQCFLQVLDNDSADRLVGKENSMFGRLRRAIIGIPVWKGHPDLREHSPETLGNAAPRAKLGTISEIRKGERGVEGRFVLDNDGVNAVNSGFKFPSALWLVLPNGETKNGAAVCHPFKLLSVGLTDRPNISGVESLANQQEKENPMLRETLIGTLISRGLILTNDVTDQQIMQIIANGDYPGHPFHGNQYADGSSGRSETNRASGAAHAASAKAMSSGGKADHLAAAAAHLHAAAAANKAGNATLALHHDMMRNFHQSEAKAAKK